MTEYYRAAILSSSVINGQESELVAIGNSIVLSMRTS
jgi:hypothetical protein